MTEPTPTADPTRLAQALIRLIRPHNVAAIGVSEPGRLDVYGLVDNVVPVHIGYLDVGTLTFVPNPPTEPDDGGGDGA
jgi:hypothetical protein